MPSQGGSRWILHVKASAKWDRDRKRNLPKLEGAVKRWIGEAEAHEDGPHLLKIKADVLSRFYWTLYRASADNLDPPAHLAGLTAFDLAGAEMDLYGAATALERKRRI